MNEIYSAVVAESARWGDSSSSTTMPGPGGGTTTSVTRTRNDDWLVQASWLRDTYMAQRTAIVLGQIEDEGWYPSVDAPEFSQHGGTIPSGFSLTVSGSGTIYYTTDGSDPREVGGSVAGTAYTSAITLNHSAQVKARVLSGGTWSALTKATFVLSEDSPLRITEIMYHPADDRCGRRRSGIRGVRLRVHRDPEHGRRDGRTRGNGVLGRHSLRFHRWRCQHTLAPGEYAILVSNLDGFKARYANWADIKIAGEYHGRFFIATASLDNSGENITLVDGLGNTVLEFEYNDSWYEITDGEGYSLTLIDPTADTTTWGDSASWRPSKYTGGTPGEGPEDSLSPGDLLINEALTHQDDDTPGDWIELYNASDDTLDINGWFLSDDEDDLEKIQLSGLPAIGPGEYLVLTEATHFGMTVGRNQRLRAQRTGRRHLSLLCGGRRN